MWRMWAQRIVIGPRRIQGQDFAVPVLRSGGVDPSQAKLIGADGNRSAYDRIRKGDQYQGHRQVKRALS